MIIAGYLLFVIYINLMSIWWVKDYQKLEKVEVITYSLLFMNIVTYIF